MRPSVRARGESPSLLAQGSSGALDLSAGPAVRSPSSALEVATGAILSIPLGRGWWVRGNRDARALALATVRPGSRIPASRRDTEAVIESALAREILRRVCSVPAGFVTTYGDLCP